uniref:acyl carrier protein n=1 Tax=Bacteroides ovatus TaxID=28116 RepID=UPI00359C580C
MEKSEITKKVIALVQKLSDSNSIKESDSFEELGITSLKFIRLVVDLEKECEMRFDDGDINLALFNRVEDIVKYIYERKEK